MMEESNPRETGHTIYDWQFSKSPFPSTSSWANKPAATSMARRPFWSSLVCMVLSSSLSTVCKPRGSKPSHRDIFSRRRLALLAGTFSGTTHSIVVHAIARYSTNGDSRKAIQIKTGTWAKWVMAGPVICQLTM